jgi:hypothetical protein
LGERNVRARYTPVVLRTMRNLLERGLDHMEVAEIMGLSPRHVRENAQFWGIFKPITKCRVGRYTPEVKAKLIAMDKAGETRCDMMRELDINGATLYRWMEWAGIHERRYSNGPNRAGPGAKKKPRNIHSVQQLPARHYKTDWSQYETA